MNRNIFSQPLNKGKERHRKGAELQIQTTYTFYRYHYFNKLRVPWLPYVRSVSHGIYFTKKNIHLFW